MSNKIKATAVYLVGLQILEEDIYFSCWQAIHKDEDLGHPEDLCFTFKKGMTTYLLFKSKIYKVHMYKGKFYWEWQGVPIDPKLVEYFKGKITF